MLNDACGPPPKTSVYLLMNSNVAPMICSYLTSEWLFFFALRKITANYSTSGHKRYAPLTLNTSYQKYDRTMTRYHFLAETKAKGLCFGDFYLTSKQGSVLSLPSQ